MKLSSKSLYAIKCLMELAKSPNESINLEEVSKTHTIPLKFLQNIMLSLKNGGFVESKRGPGGGYLLIEAPEDLILGDIIRHLDGDFNPASSLPAASQGNHAFDKVMDQVWLDVAKNIEYVVDNLTLDHMLKRANEMDKTANMFYI